MSGAGVDIDEFVIRQPQQNGASILLSLDSFAGSGELGSYRVAFHSERGQFGVQVLEVVGEGIDRAAVLSPNDRHVDVRLGLGSLLAQLFERGRHFLLSFHHQCVNLIADRAILFGQVFAIAFNDGIDDHSA